MTKGSERVLYSKSNERAVKNFKEANLNNQIISETYYDVGRGQVG